MNTFDIVVKTPTGSDTRRAKLYESGIIHFEDGTDEWTTLMNEKTRGFDVLSVSIKVAPPIEEEKEVEAIIPQKKKNRR